MIQCPKCSSSLPDWAQTCQFCGTDTKAVARPKPAPGKARSAPVGQPAWVWPAYYIVSGYFVVSGLVEVVRALVMMNAKTNNAEGAMVAQYSVIGLVVGVITVIIGAGLLAKVEFIRGIVNFFCYLKILGGLCGIGGSLFAGLFVGPAALFALLMSVFDIATAVLMIFLIAETD